MLCLQDRQKHETTEYCVSTEPMEAQYLFYYAHQFTPTTAIWANYLSNGELKVETYLRDKKRMIELCASVIIVIIYLIYKVLKSNIAF